MKTIDPSPFFSASFGLSIYVYRSTMDGYLLSLCVICMIVILFYYLLNYVQKINDPLELFKLIRKQEYDAQAYSLGWNETQKKYENIFFNAKLEYQRSFDPYPVDKTGKYITTIYDNHGKIDYTENNGYSINGVLTKFPCPDGYEGADCHLKPLCRDPEDDNKALPLTDTQFNALQLFRNDAFSEIASRDARRDPLYHNRIFIQCKTKGNYELKVCATNKLLDLNTMKCNLYDICEDRLNGFKHNFAINNNDSALADNEYYICDSNKSKKLKCNDDTVFSSINKGCVQKNVCFNQGRTTIPIDEYNYIQCENDTGIKKHCPNKVMTLDDGTLSCKTNNCKPSTLVETTECLTYNYGAITCNDKDEEETLLCDQEMTKRRWTYNWGNDFAIEIDWPVSILQSDGVTCGPPKDDSILTNPVIKTKWTDLMFGYYDWNLLQEKFVCQDNDYRWDYRNKMLIKGDEKFDEQTSIFKMIDTSKPCQQSEYQPIFMKFKNYKTHEIPYKFVSLRVYLGDVKTYLWPMLKDGKYRATQCFYDYTNRKMIIRTYYNEKEPIGFKPTDKEDVNLDLLTDEKIAQNDHQWWCINSGTFEGFTFSVGDPEYTDTVIDCPTSVDISIDQKFAILWDNYKTKTSINAELSCDQYGIFKNGPPEVALCSSTYIVFTLKNKELIIDSEIPSVALSTNLQLL